MNARIILGKFFLSQTHKMLMCIKHASVTRAKCHIVMYKVLEVKILRIESH
jgi:hypothetical protein